MCTMCAAITTVSHDRLFDQHSEGPTQHAHPPRAWAEQDANPIPLECDAPSGNPGTSSTTTARGMRPCDATPSCQDIMQETTENKPPLS